MKKIIKLLLACVMLLIASNNTFAQEKYDFLVISLYNAPLSSQINTSLNGEEFTSETIKKDKGSKDMSNLNPLIRKIKEYQDKNWEVMNFNTVQSAGSSIGIMFFVFLRKKTE
jgi:hypothetical protein